MLHVNRILLDRFRFLAPRQATVSPSSTCYSETVNTLRFGQRAKLIVYKPVIVEDSKENTIRELRAEIAKLRELLRLSSQISPAIVPEMHKPNPTTPQEEVKAKNPEHAPVSSETLVPIMNVKSSVPSKKLKRTFSVDRTYSLETDNSKSFSSQESLQSPKHSKASSSRKHSGGSASASPTIQPKQTALSLRRQSINRSTPSLKTITQKKILAPMSKKLEKGVVTEVSGVKKVDPGKKGAHQKPRAQIVAAVTSRLYNKVNKKDMGTSTENLAVAPKEPPKELTICLNARNRLRELTHKALKAHRSRHEETQTDLFPILRVKEIGTDCPDLDQLEKQPKKDAEVECKQLNQFIEGTLKNILVLTRSCGIQATADEKTTSNVSFKKYLTESPSNPIFTEAVNINISHNYASSNASDDSLDNQRNNVSFPTPDLISNHNSLEQHALSSEDNEEAKVSYAETCTVQDSFEKVSYMPSSKVCSNTVQVLTVSKCPSQFKNVKVLTAHAPETMLQDPLQEKCQSLPGFCPKKAKAKVTNCKETKQDRRRISYHKPFVYLCEDYQSSGESSDSGEINACDSMEYHRINNRKVQFVRKNKKEKHDRILKAMREFLEEAKTLMTNIGGARSNCQHPHLDDFDIQVTVNDVSGLEGTHKKRRKNLKIAKECMGTQTEQSPTVETCSSQTSVELPEYLLPINKYEILLEDSCRRLENRIHKTPRSRHISMLSDDYDDDILFERHDRPKYNPWDIGNFEVEDSSLESNPVTFSDYGSLPRKTHKRQRTPTCSPSAFLKQLTHMRRQVIENSRDEMFQSGSGDK